MRAQPGLHAPAGAPDRAPIHGGSHLLVSAAPTPASGRVAPTPTTPPPDTSPPAASPSTVPPYF
jgi:hypothetical protein